MSKISVLMCVYNTPNNYIAKAVDSILKQTLRDYEFIIYDDGSKKETVDFLQKISSTDNRIKLILNNENHGLGYGLNRCLEHATSEYVARMDADDYCDVTRLEKQLSYLITNNLDVVGCNMFYFENDKIYGRCMYEQIIEDSDFLFNSPISHPTIVAKKKAFDLVGGYCEEKWCLRNEDYELFMRMQKNGLHLGNLSECLYYFREDLDAASRRKFKYRINEFNVRRKGFQQLNLYPKGFLYIWKPIFIGLLPKGIYRNLRKKQIGKDGI